MSEADETNENEETAAEETPEAVEDTAGADAPQEADGDGAEEAEAEAEVEVEAEPEAAEQPAAEAEADDDAPEGSTAEGEAEDAEPEDEVPEEYRDAADEAPVDEGVEVDAADVVALAAKTARVYLCECGYRTYAVWSEPTVCKKRPTRHGPECGKQLYPMDELPEQVQKALNPLKASKKRAAGTA